MEAIAGVAVPCGACDEVALQSESVGVPVCLSHIRDVEAESSYCTKVNVVGSAGWHSVRSVITSNASQFAART